MDRGEWEREHTVPKHRFDSYQYIQITWRDGERRGWGHEWKWNVDAKFPASEGSHTLLSIVPKTLYPNFPDSLPTHRREIDLYPEFKQTSGGNNGIARQGRS